MRGHITRIRSYLHGTTLGQTLLWLAAPIHPSDVVGCYADGFTPTRREAR